MGPFSTYSQIGLRFSYIKHSGDLGYLLKPALNIEVTYNVFEKDQRFKATGSLGYMPLSTRLDTVPITSYQIDGGTHFVNSYIIYSKMHELTFGINMEFKILDRPFSPVAGADIYINLLEYEYEFDNPVDRHMYANETRAVFGILPRIGFSWDMTDEMVLSGGIGKQIGFDNKFEPYNLWKIYTGIQYFF
jgi:hypothetical protein